MVTDACPPLAAVPAYLMGFLVRMIAQRCALVVNTFVGTFESVLGDLFWDMLTSAKAVVVPAAEGSSISGAVLAAMAWLLVRRT